MSSLGSRRNCNHHVCRVHRRRRRSRRHPSRVVKSCAEGVRQTWGEKIDADLVVYP